MHCTIEVDDSCKRTFQILSLYSPPPSTRHFSHIIDGDKGVSPFSHHVSDPAFTQASYDVSLYVYLCIFDYIDEGSCLVFDVR